VGGAFLFEAMHKLDPEDPETIVVFTDGSCWPTSKGDGGWSFYLSYRGKQAVRYGFQSQVTNNRMELMAVARALQFIPTGGAAPILILTDSQYVKGALIDWVDGWRATGWKTSTGTPVKNRRLILDMLSLLETHRSSRIVEMAWVRGHTGIPENELADQNANRARKEKLTNWSKGDVRCY
jgi:ribonuclease HI